MVVRKCIVVLGLSAGLIGTPPSALATTFDGNCQVAGDGAYTAPAGYLPAANRWWMEGRGGCTGLLNGARVVNHPVRLQLEFDDPIASCAASLATGGGTLAFGTAKRRKRVLRFTQDHVGPVASIAGATAGGGLAYLTAYTQFARQDPAAPLHCANGTLTSFAAEWAMRTTGPLEG